MKAYRLYLALEGLASLALSMIFTISMIYQVETVGMNPLQLVLAGTALETSVFLFEIPTGVIADVYSRKLSIVIGYFIMGFGFLLQALLPVFAAIALGEALWGLGYTFTSGATQAWISDEIGEAKANRAFLRGSQVAELGGLIGILIGVALGNLNLWLPILAGGLLLMGVGLFLALLMPETGFKPKPKEGRSTWRDMAQTFRGGFGMLRLRPILATILLIGLFYGLYSEGYDRLWTKHLLESFTFPTWWGLNSVTWFGVIRVGGVVLAVSATEVVRRRVNIENSRSIVRFLILVTGLLILSLVTLAHTGGFFVALAAIWGVGVTRTLIGPVYTGWVNQKLDSRVRATVISMSSQVDAIGQIAGGPVMGLVGNLVSVRAAITLSGMILSPILALFARHLGQQPAAEPAITET